MAKINLQLGWSVLCCATKEAASVSSLETFGFSFRVRRRMESDQVWQATSWHFLTFSPSSFHKSSFLHLLFINLLYSSPPFLSLCSTYMVTEYMGIRNESFMKMAAVGTWMGDFVTAWMVRWFSTTPCFFFTLTSFWVDTNIMLKKR